MTESSSDKPGIAGFDPRVAKGHEEEAIALGEAEAVAMAKGEHIRSPLVIARGLWVLRQRAIELSGSASANGRRYAEELQRQLKAHPGYLPLLSDDHKKAKRMVTDGLWCIDHWTVVAPFIEKAGLDLVELNLSSLRVLVQKDQRHDAAAADAEDDDEDSDEGGHDAESAADRAKAEMRAYVAQLVAEGLASLLKEATPQQVAEAVVETFASPQAVQVITCIELLLDAKAKAAPGPKAEPEVEAAKRKRGRKPKGGQPEAGA